MPGPSSPSNGPLQRVWPTTSSLLNLMSGVCFFSHLGSASGHRFVDCFMNHSTEIQTTQIVSSIWRAAVGDRHLRDVSVPRHWLVPGLRIAGERLPYGPTRGLPREGVRAYEGLWVKMHLFRTWLEARYCLATFLILFFFVFFPVRLEVEPVGTSIFCWNTPSLWDHVPGVQHLWWSVLLS